MVHLAMLKGLNSMISFSLTPGMSEEKIEERENKKHAAGGGMNIVVEKSTGEGIGVCGVNNFEERNKLSDFGIILDRLHWGKGFPFLRLNFH